MKTLKSGIYHKMKLIIVTPYWTPIIGGVTTNVLNLVKTLQKRKNIYVSVITRKGDSNRNVYAINSNKILFVIKTFFILCKKRPDVIHSQSWWYTLLPSVLYKILFRKTLIHTFHTDLSMEEQAGYLDPFKGRIFAWLLNRCEVITFVSENLMEKIRRIMSLKTQTKVIYNGVSKREVDKGEIEAFIKRYSLGNCYPIISWIGPFVYKQKIEGLKLLIKAFRSIIIKYPGAELLIIGDGDYREELERFVKELNINNNVVFTGFLENVFIPLELTDIYAHTSLQDSMPASILEVMSAGKPVIAVPTGGIPEVVMNNKTGILVEPEPKLIADTLIKLYEDKARMKYLGRNAKKLVEKRFTWEITSKEFEKIYLGNVNKVK